MNENILKNFLLFFTSFVAITCISQTKQANDTTDRLIKKIMKEKHIPGMAIAVLKNGKVIRQGYYGKANLEYNIPVTNKTVFEIASMSKQFACAAILLLQQEKKLTINDKLSNYIDSLPDSWQNMTLYQLMTHTSGLRDDWEEDNDYFLHNNSNEKMLEAQKSYPLRFAPGEGFTYGNGPFELGLVVEKVSGQSYARFMKEKIFVPLGMNSTSIYDNRRIISNRAAGYVWNDSVQTNGNDIPPAAEGRADVGVISSLPDMIRWDLALGTDKLLNEESRKAMFTPAKLNDGTFIGYSFGWFVYPLSGMIYYEHSGGFRTGFNSDILRIPEKDIAVIVLANQWKAGAASVAFKLSSIYETSVHFLSAKNPKPDPNASRTRELKSIMQKLANKEWNYKQLYHQYNVCGADPDDLQGILNGFKGLQYLDQLDLKKHPVTLFDQELTKVIYYKAMTDKPFYFGFYYNRKGRLVVINYEP
jgi:CubicO group peptidase (beta-lactamase class C family)